MRAGVAAALAAAVLFGVTTPIAKQLLTGTQPLLIAGLLYLGSGLGVSALRFIQDRRWSATGLTAGDWPWLGLTILVGGIVAPALLMLGLVHADAADASLLLNLEVVFTAALAWLVFREPANSRVVWGVGGHPCRRPGPGLAGTVCRRAQPGSPGVDRGRVPVLGGG